MFDNVHSLLNDIYSKPSTTTPKVVISIDSEKAFDRVEYNYLFEVLGRFGLGEVFISWIRLLYTSPQASIHTNGMQSNFFSLLRGTRQGCPLSALLFAITIEPLSIYFRSSPVYAGITRLKMEFKLMLTIHYYTFLTQGDPYLLFKLFLEDIAHSQDIS